MNPGWSSFEVRSNVGARRRLAQKSFPDDEVLAAMFTAAFLQPGFNV